MNKFIGIFCFMSLVSGCAFRHDKNSDAASTQTSGVDASTGLLDNTSGFSHIQKKILNNRCLSCHGGRQQPYLGTYAAVKSNADAIRNAVFVKKSMPKSSSLSRAEGRLLRMWLDAGAPEQAPVEEPIPDPVPNLPGHPVRWSVLAERVLIPKCLACHTGENPKGKVDLSSLQSVRPLSGALLFTTLSTIDNEMVMPPLPAELTTDEKELVSNWVIDGMHD